MDRLLRWIKDIQQAKYFDIQNVSEYFWHHTEEHWDLVQMTLAPPFDFFATRYTLPERVYSKEHGWTDFPKQMHGAEMLTVFRVVDQLPPVLDPKGQFLIGDQAGHPAMVPSAKWHYDIWLFPALGRHVEPPTRWFMAVDEKGRVATQASGEPAFWIVENFARHQITVVPVSYLHVSALALTFLHCRNVEIIDPPPVSKKRLPRKIKFESRYHRLKVNAIGQKRVSAGPGNKTGITQAFHIIRGHFRTYGPEFGKGKLFGKYSGRYWVAAHFKGDSEVGTVDKDYEVGAPGSE